MNDEVPEMQEEVEEPKPLRSWELPDAFWELMEPLLPVVNWRMGRPTEVDLRRVAAGVFYVLRTGCQWNALPRESFAAPGTVYYYFRQWQEYDVFRKLWAKALERYDELKGLDWMWQSLDGAMTKAPQGGEKNRAQSNGPGQVGNQTQPADGWAGDPAGAGDGGSQRAGYECAGGDAGGGGAAAAGDQRGREAELVLGQRL